jgi:hypothetical protein
MTRKFWLASTVCAVALAVACSKQSASPTSPSSTALTSGNAAADGSTLKVTAPTPVSPVNGVKLQQGEAVNLVINNSTATYASSVPLRYEFAVVDGAGRQIFVRQTDSGSGTTSVNLDEAPLEAEQTYQWHARAFYGEGVGPWSAFASFIAPQNKGYIRGNELYDPLINGETVGVLHGPTQWWQTGIHLDDFTSYISYELPQTLEEGEFSFIISNIKSAMAGGKTKMMAMSKGYDDIITNEYRATFEKRGDGTVAWRFIARDDQIDTEGGERVYIELSRAHEYLVKMEWRGNFFNASLQQDITGEVVYSFGKAWDGRGYVPSPHIIFVGAPVGRSGPDAATVPGMVARQVWVSSRPRPAFANK